MALVTWDASYSVKVGKCDEEHQKLFSLLNTLHDSMKAGKGAEVVQKVVKELADYTKFHFAREESLMEKTNYPALGPHRVQHQEFVRKVEQFKQDLDAGDTHQAIPVAEFIKNWLTGHIKGIDQGYSAHMNAKGVF